MKHLVLLSCLAMALASSHSLAADAPKLELKDGDRVAFIGNTFVEREQVDGYIEAALTSRYPDRNITFRNLGYSADTVTGSARGLCIGWSQFEAPDKAFERLKKLVAEYKPTVLLMNYGMTESFLGPDGLPEFVANYNKMLDALSTAAGTSPRIILMSPNYHEDLGRPLPDPAEHNKNLEAYSGTIGDIAAKRNAGFIDLFGITKSADEKEHLTLTTNGIHLTPFGYWYVADVVALSFNGADGGWFASLDSQGGSLRTQKAKISDAKAKDGKITFVISADRLPEMPLPTDAPKYRPVIPQMLFFQGLPPGNYQVKAGDKVLATGMADEWVAGRPLRTGPEFEQAEALRKLIVAKNFDYFNYQRPDNDSYILAFRKREQGRNAVEIPQFLPLVEEKEKQIAELRVPKPVTYTLELVK